MIDESFKEIKELFEVAYGRRMLSHEERFIKAVYEAGFTDGKISSYKYMKDKFYKKKGWRNPPYSFTILSLTRSYQ